MVVVRTCVITRMVLYL